MEGQGPQEANLDRDAVKWLYRSLFQLTELNLVIHLLNEDKKGKFLHFTLTRLALKLVTNSLQEIGLLSFGEISSILCRRLNFKDGRIEAARMCLNNACQETGESHQWADHLGDIGSVLDERKGRRKGCRT